MAEPLTGLDRISIGASGLTVNAGQRSLPELLNVAAAAARSRTQVRMTGLRTKPIEDLVRIAVTGGDCVTFASETAPPPKAAPKRGWFFLS